jgi:hypothetical protein
LICGEEEGWGGRGVIDLAFAVVVHRVITVWRSKPTLSLSLILTPAISTLRCVPLTILLLSRIRIGNGMEAWLLTRTVPMSAQTANLTFSVGEFVIGEEMGDVLTVRSSAFACFSFFLLLVSSCLTSIAFTA